MTQLAPSFRFALCALVPLLGAAGGLAAQNGTGNQGGDPLLQLQARCVQLGGAEARCGDAALALEASLLASARALAGGSPLPASSSTAGRRLPGDPRVVMDGGLLWGSYTRPTLGGDETGSAATTRRTLMGARGTLAMGLFEGFSPAPTVGGVLGVDLLGTARYVGDLGSLDASTVVWGAGARLGVFRESFVLPGVTLSALHLRGGEFVQTPSGNEASSVTVRPRVTSYRAVAGKDLLALGIAVGGGIDQIRGSGVVQVPRADGNGTAGAALSGDGSTLRRDTPVVFAGVNFTWVVLQLATEVTWSPSGDPIPGLAGSGAFSGPGSGWSGALTLRLTY